MVTIEVVTSSLLSGSATLSGERPAGLADLASAAAATAADAAWEGFVAQSERHRTTAGQSIDRLRQGLVDAAHAYADTDRSVVTGALIHE